MTKDKTEQIREEFDKRFERIVEHRQQSKYHRNYIAIHIVRKLLEEQKQEMVEEIEKLRISKTNCDPGAKIGNPYNQALDTVLSIIKNK